MTKPKYRVGDGKLTLLEATALEHDYWVREMMQELQSSLASHMSLWQGNEAHWDVESAWGAFQTVNREIIALYLQKMLPCSPLTVGPHCRAAFRVAKEFILRDTQHIGDLVREGATTPADAAEYTRMFVAFMTTQLALAQRQPIVQATATWKRLYSPKGA